MEALQLLGTALNVSLLLAVLPGTLYLLVLTLAGLRRPGMPTATVPKHGLLAIVVPAHNEAAGMARTLQNLTALAAADGDALVCVVADNCNDATADVARGFGVQVLERQDSHRRGKGYALDFAFQALMKQGCEIFVVVDADTVANADLLAAVRLHMGAGASAVQARYTVLDADASPRMRLAELALTAFNVLRPRAREAMGWSAGILGNGFALTRAALERVPYTAASVVEDLEYHLKLIETGIRVRFIDTVAVRGAMPAGAQGQASQRARWEGGRLRMLRQHGPDLLLRGLAGQWRMWEPLLELLLLPLAHHATLLMALTLLPWPAGRWFGLAGLVVLAVHALAAALVGHLGLLTLWHTLLQLPRYMAWKLSMLPSTLRNACAGAAWVRTDRDPPST